MGTMCQRSFLNLTFYLQRRNFLAFHKTIQGAFWCVNYLATWLNVFVGSMLLKVLRSYISFTPPPPKQSTSAQNPTATESDDSNHVQDSVLSIQFRGLLN